MSALWLNIGSLLLGVFAWSLPIINLLKERKSDENQLLVAVTSLSACAISLCLQMYYTYHKLIIEDWAALMDTMATVIYAASVLVAVTVFLNVVMVVKFRNRYYE
ncbi:hypothetical protein [Salimicrobium flavidum]|uniref:Cytochrome c oxidase subunit 4 n=1 Tax=Salimicrobium flavidum TaxID=570947 RepID=A0A1N7JA61_9BACI|nr:hypothetical protein [Salimicrobium flavidum]SIS46243.1 cytochrome c oxidase subunit 4 [Salimicrobium flavidum]